MEKKTAKLLQSVLFSGLGVLSMAVLLVAVNVISGTFNGRVDLTEERLYTLSEGTRRLLQRLDTPVTLRFYYSKDVAQMPPFLKNHAQQVEDLLKEYKQAGGDKVIIQRFNPKPDSDAEEAAALDGISGQSTGAGDPLYLGLAVTCLDETITLPFLSPDRETLLEYDLTRAIHRVQRPERPVLGVMSPLPVMGTDQATNPMLAMRGQGGQPAWIALSELRRDFDVRTVEPVVERIDAGIDTLLLIHPADLPEHTLFAIDQFVLRGGRLIAFLDPLSIVQSQDDPMRQMGHMGMPPAASTLTPLLGAWGITFDAERVVADLMHMTQVQSRQLRRPESLPTVLSLPRHSMDASDPATAQLSNVVYVFGGAFSGVPVDGLSREVLLHSSKESQQIEKFMAQMPGDEIVKRFEPGGVEQALAIRLSGRFKTAFPEGRPGAPQDAPVDDDATIHESAVESAVVLVGDADMLHDHFAVQKFQLMGQTLASPINDNLTLLQNLVEQLSGDTQLIGIRSRGTMSRPFLVVREMQAQAERRYQDQIKALESEVQDLQRKIGELQASKGGDQRLILSPEQMAAIEEFRQSEAAARRRLREVRKQFRRDIDALENKLKWTNIAAMPAAVCLVGLSLAVVKRRRMVRR